MRWRICSVGAPPLRGDVSAGMGAVGTFSDSSILFAALIVRFLLVGFHSVSRSTTWDHPSTSSGYCQLTFRLRFRASLNRAICSGVGSDPNVPARAAGFFSRSDRSSLDPHSWGWWYPPPRGVVPVSIGGGSGLTPPPVDGGSVK